MFIKYGLLSSYLYLMYYNINRLNTNNISEITYGSIVGYYFGGFISGLVHWYFDTYDSNINFLNDIHNNFRGHHIIPEDIIPTDYLTLLTEIVPITYVFFSISYLTQNQIIISSMIMTNLVGNLAQLIHKYSHQRKHENDKNEDGSLKYSQLPTFIKFLQDKRIILHPYEHKIHHETEIINYCISHSHSDRLFEYFINNLHFSSAFYMRNNQKLKKIKYNEKDKYIKNTTIIDVLKEQRFLLFISFIYSIIIL